MKKSNFKVNNLLNYIYLNFINLPTPLNINIWWNFGSMLGMCLMIQILSGLFLSMHYTPNIINAFNSIIHIIQDVNMGWLIRLIHMNGASMFFICMFIHIGRNLYFHSFFLTKTWITGVMIFLLSMMTAFLGYVLPWGQMSFWGATVITNLISAIPYLGTMLTEWIWGGFSVNNATLNRFFSLHFILPLIILIMVMLHLIFLHEYGSSNSMGIYSNSMKIPFHFYYSIKDFVGFIFLFFFLLMICFLNPYMMSDPENFIMANSMITPIHIQPEWYFLFAYAILRSIPNKLGGVIALFMSIIILFFIPMFKFYKLNSNKFYIFNKYLYFMFLMNFYILTWIGSKPIEYPFMIIGQISSIFYFSYFFIFPLLNKIQDLYMYKFLN